MSREVRLARPDDMPAVYALRHVVFVLGQDVPEEMERDDLDEGADHGVAFSDGMLVATGRLLPPAGDTAATVGRMAVDGEVRGQGFGTLVLELLEQTARERGWPAVELHAQLHAKPFYDRAGYVPYGDVYLEAGIEHLSMRKDL